MLKAVYHLSLRAPQRFVASILDLLGAKVSMMNYITLCRCLHTLDVRRPVAGGGEPLHLVVDSSGIKIFGEGEWKVRKHGYSKRRTWRKLHLGVDEASGQIVAALVTTADWADCEVLPELLEQVDGELEQVSGDGAFDTRDCYDAIDARGARAAIPPKRGAKIWRHGNKSGPRHLRDENLRRIRQVGRAEWKREVDYHRRSLAETCFFRIKTIFGPSVSARTLDGQHAELMARCIALNRMTQLGMPDSYAAL